jgi:membrane protease YdiL (CAAX protease family)
LVIGIVSIIGREAILPMALLYVVIHFGKPLTETISSFFGGYILGVFAYKYKNIMGGIIIHIALAWMMELAAIIQHLKIAV